MEKSGIKVYGYFEENIDHSELVKQNKWKFIITPQKDNTREITIFEGKEFSKLSVKNARITNS